MSKIKNGGLDQYDAGPFEQQQFGTAGGERVNNNAVVEEREVRSRSPVIRRKIERIKQVTLANTVYDRRAHCAVVVLTLSSPITLRLYTLPYWQRRNFTLKSGGERRRGHMASAWSASL